MRDPAAFLPFVRLIRTDNVSRLLSLGKPRQIGRCERDPIPAGPAWVSQTHDLKLQISDLKSSSPQLRFRAPQSG